MKHLGRAIKYAQEHVYPKQMEYRLCAVIVKGGKILSVGFNKFGSSGLIRRYNRQPFDLNIHAEVDAVQQVRNKIDLTGSVIYVARILRKDKDDVVMAMPCEMCQAVLTAYGISKAYFTVDNDVYGMLAFKREK